MIRNCRVDLERQSQGSAPILTRDDRPRTRPHRVEERRKLQPQRLALLHRDLLQRQASRRMILVR